MTDQLDLFDDTAQRRRPGEQRVPPGSRRGTCQSCNAPVRWITTARGLQMPIAEATIQTIDGEEWGLSHFVDCPQARGWSKKASRKS